MRLAATLAAAALIAGPAAAQSNPVHMKWMGNLSCGAWPKYAAHDDLRKAVLLNWALGFLSRGAIANNADLLAEVDQASVSAWLDAYCAAHPLDKITTAASELEAELLQRERQR